MRGLGVRIFQRRRVQRGLDAMNMTPLIDIIFQLLIFFMLSSSFSFPSGIDVKLPKAVTSDKVQAQDLVITITSENVIYLNNGVVTMKELEKYLTMDDNKNRPVLIRSDRRSSMGRIVDVWDLARSLGVQQINIATNQKE